MLYILTADIVPQTAKLAEAGLHGDASYPRARPAHERVPRGRAVEPLIVDVIIRVAGEEPAVRRLRWPARVVHDADGRCCCCINGRGGDLIFFTPRDGCVSYR